ncbi:MAG TPA: branched-chain amino acid ABC transporter permease [Thermoanaerobaculia bacterium]|nr:branched-chain amino acid ABC transporter permease [Thermoanaerobaculia bacterium]
MKTRRRMPWIVRDAILFASLILGIIALWWGLEYAAAWWPTMNYINRIIVLIGINITLAVSLNIISGHAGQFSLGHAGFMATGAYFSAYLTVTFFEPYVKRFEGTAWLYAVMQNVMLIVAILAAALVSAIAGYIVGLPSLRLRGDYLAIVTLGFGEIIRVLILNIEAVGAARGLPDVPGWSNFFWVFFFAALTILISVRLVKSSVGRAFLAVREDQIAAEAMGVDTTRYKVKAFIIGSSLAGVAGALYAHYVAYLNPEMFKFIRSFEVIVMVVLGGLGSITGSIVSAIVLTILPEALRQVKELRMIIYSIMLIVLMLTRPQGLFGRRELWDFLPKRKDRVPDEARDEGHADDGQQR